MLHGPGAGMPEYFWDWDTAILTMPPETPTAPYVFPGSLVSKDALSRGEYSFTFGRLSGRRLTRVQCQLFDEQGELLQDMNMNASEVEGATETLSYGKLSSSFKDLLPGEQYNLRVCIHSGAGASEWSPLCDLIRMPPDRPEQCAPMLSELASPSYIEVEWKPPHCNGAPILKYEVMMSLDENDESSWSAIDPNILAEHTYDYGHDGRRVTERDAGSKVYNTERDGSVLDPNVRYFFKVRACNSVGWGAWSIPQGFLTKSVKPGKAKDINLVSSGINDVSIAWQEPLTHGKEILRYDLFASTNLAYISWVSITTALLATTVDVSKVSGVSGEEPLGDDVMNKEFGKDQFDELICDHLMYVPLSPDRLKYNLTGLLPGSTYYFMVRGVNGIGIGEFSSITPAAYTLSDKLGGVEPMVVQSVTETDAKVSFRLPFNQGSKIEEVAVTLNRVEGPLSPDEIDPETGDCHVHLAGQKHTLRPEDVECTVPTALDKISPIKVAGYSYALRQNLLHEGISGPTEHVPSFMVATGKNYSLSFPNLRPGTSYEAFWSCRSGISWSSQSESTTFITEASIPDDPVPMVVFGL
jgi:hypothetical protein